jgi:asparagine synthase (glutamine-hydrolysing)
VPSWWWISDGRDRAVARDAFAPRLPLSVLTRRSKGTPDSFLAELYRHNRSRIRTMLLEGRLRAFGLIDLAAIELATAPGPVVDTTYLRMLQLADVEAWLTAQG